MAGEAVTIILGVLGALGAIPLAIGGLRWARGRRVARSVLRFNKTPLVDVVVTTSELSPSSVGVDATQRPVRPLTAVGELHGIAALANFLGQHYPRKQLHIHQSRLLEKSLDDDLVLLGGPIHNECSAEFLEALRAQYPHAEIALDAHERCLTLGGFRLTNERLQMSSEGVPVEDYALVVLAPNPFRPHRRAILCAGFTTYGTGAAAEYVFKRLLEKRAGEAKGFHLRRRERSVAIALKATFSHRSPYRFTELARLDLTS